MNRKRLRELVYQKYDGHCAYCGREIAMKDMQVDHIISRYKNGTDDLDNLNPACRMCNFRKGVYTIEQFRREIQNQAKTAMRTFGNRMSAVYGLISYTPHEVEFYFEKRKKRIIMEENKKVFIKGLKGRGSEIIDKLTKLGATNTENRYNDNGDYIYFIHHNNEIGVALINSEVGAIIMDNYKEVELPQRPWEDGDILAFDFGSGSCCSGVYAVFKKYTENDTFESYILVNDDDVCLGISCPTGACRLANEVEKEDFRRRFSFLKSHLEAAIAVLNKDTE